MVTVEEVRNAQRAEGPATVLAIGTANPPNVFYQSTYPDYFFRITNSEHKTELKKKFQRICEGSAVEKRYMYFNEDILKANPNVCEYKATSLNCRQKIVVEETPKLAKESALKALKEWGQPLSKITHLVFCSTSGVEMPGIDHKLIKLLGLQPSVKRVMLYHIGCFAGGKVLRVAKDLAENNKGARVLVVSAELSVITFHGPCETHLDNLVGQAIFGDGSASLVVGSDPLPGEKPLFEFVSAAQNILPDSEGAIMGHLQEAGLIFHLSKNVPKAICNSIEKALVKAFEPLGISDWNSIFYIPHPGGRAILDQMEARLGLKPEKFQAARYSLAKYGNMSSASVLFVMDRMRKHSAEEGAKTTGEGCEWGAVLGFGPGLTLETVVLHSVAI